MISLILAILCIILFIFFCIVGGNYVLRSMVDNVLTSKEGFINSNDANDLIINPVDNCSKIDNDANNQLNFQTATNIPLSPNYYKNYIGKTYIDNQQDYSIENPNAKYCLKKSKLLYDGIWDSNINVDNNYEIETWNLTNGNLSDGYYCSNKLIETNKPFPVDYVDMSATPPITSGNYYTYFNDTKNDIFDTEIQCFPSVFNAGITEDLRPIA